VKHKLRPSAVRIPLFFGAAIAAGFGLNLSAYAARPLGPAADPGLTQYKSAAAPTLAQDDDSDETEVPDDQIQKYVSVYKAMQRNRSLTVEQAASRQGLTLQQFRDLENRIQRDDAALQQARDELQAAAKQSSPSPEKHTTKHSD
jgi:hypothetical protein